MGNWPGAAADDWWDGLPVPRKEQIHRWVTQRTARDDLPPAQLALDLTEDQTLGSLPP